MSANLTKAEIDEVASKAARRLMVTVEGVQSVTRNIDLSRPASLSANAQTGAK